VAVSALFPDPFVFLGGDEVDASCWQRNARVAAWLLAHNATAAELQPYFWRRVWAEVLPALVAARNGSAVVPGVWQSGVEQAIPLAQLPRGAYVNAWQGAAAVAAATAAGVRAVASGEWYTDTVAPPSGCEPVPYATQQLWRCFWRADPAAGLSDAQAALLLGGQVSAWGEGVAADTLDARLWTKAAAAAERLWSPRLAPEDVAAAAADAEERLDAHVCRLRRRGFAAEPIRAGFCEADLGDDAHESSSWHFAAAASAAAAPLRVRDAHAGMVLPQPPTGTLRSAAAAACALLRAALGWRL
jgi:hexosaminidase